MSGAFGCDVCWLEIDRPVSHDGSDRSGSDVALSETAHVLNERRAVLAVAGIAIIWGSVGVVVRQVELSAVALVSARIWIAAPALAIYIRTTGAEQPWRRRPTRLLVLNGVVLAAHWVCFIAALQRAPIGTVLLITYLAPVGIAAFAPMTLGEVVPLKTKAALGVAVAGIALIAIPAMDGTSTDGVLLAFATGALYVPLALLNKALSDTHGGVQLSLYQLLIAGAALLPFALLADWGSPTIDWLWLLALGVVYTAFGFGVYLQALMRLPATRAAVLLYLEPASAVLFGWLLLDQDPSASTIAGGLLVVGAGILVARTPMAPEAPLMIPEEVTDAAG
jgi:drug/metabolite transporter (DMT)-like permease